jgi:nicotinamide-nucleotide amidase
MRAELLTIGAELTSGATLNTNAAYLSRRLAEIGIPCQRQTTVSDERSVIIEVLQEALSRAELVITTGGLGPTFDDVTMATIAEVAKRSLVADSKVATQIRRFYARGHRALQKAAMRQASVPKGGLAMPNPIGTAPGLWLQLPTALLIALPGVPGEMRAIMERCVLPRLKRLSGADPIESLTLRTVGVPELTIEGVLQQIRVPSTIQVGLYPHLGAVDVRLSTTATSARTAQRILARLATQLQRRLGIIVYGTGSQTLEEVVGALLVKRQQSLAIAESCTGGLVSDRISDVPGSSRYLRGSIVAYHNDLKRQYLGLPATTLSRSGAVSALSAKAMAQGVRHFASADIGLAITGIAGPSGGTLNKPVGLVYLGLANRRGAHTMRCQFFGERDAIKTQAAQASLDFLRRNLLTTGDR